MPQTTRDELKDDLKASGIEASKHTISRALRHEGLCSRTPHRTPLLQKRHIKARLKFANDQLNNPAAFWISVLWSNETKIEIFGRNSTNHVWSDVHEYEECLTKFLTSVQWNKNAENCVSELLTLNDGKNTKKESTSYEEGNPYSDEPLLPPPYASNSIVSPKADSRITIDKFFIYKIHWGADPPLIKSCSGSMRPGIPPSIFNVSASCLPSPKPAPRPAKVEDQQLRDFLVLPCKRKLQYITSSIGKDQVLRETFDKVQTLQQKNVFLLVDEVQIRPTVSFSGGVLSGMAENNRDCKATSMLCIMKSLHKGPSLMISITPVHKLTAPYQLSVWRLQLLLRGRVDVPSGRSQTTSR
ncbi:Transposase Tc1-like [Trinorchestia longiramus]|nr:Transposase Tc1-like [Trinorchestia longiramus]